MKLKVYACLVVGTLVVVAPAVAQPGSGGPPQFDPFLAVDVNISRTQDVPAGPESPNATADGFQSWWLASELTPVFLNPANEPFAVRDWSGDPGAAGLSQVFDTALGPITATISGNTTPRQGRDRGGPAMGVDPYPLQDVLRDFVFAQHAGGGYGRNYIKLHLEGLMAGETYELTMFVREQAFQTNADEPFVGPMEGDSPRASYQAWTDIGALGGLDGPAAWLDANVGADASYEGIWVDSEPGDPVTLVDTGYKNPIPSLGRGPVSGLDPSDPYHYSTTFQVAADAQGEITLYTWSDANTLFFPNVQRATLFNGFQIALIPEPASIVLVGLSLVGLAFVRRRGR